MQSNRNKTDCTNSRYVGALSKYAVPKTTYTACVRTDKCTSEEKTDWTRSETVTIGSTRTNNLNDTANLEVYNIKSQRTDPEHAMPEVAGNGLT